MRKSQTTAFSFLLFYVGKLIFCQKTYLKKLNLYCYIRIAVFSRGHTSIQTTWRQTRYFNVDFDSSGLCLLHTYFRQVLQFRTKKYINLGNKFHYKRFNERNRNISKMFVFIFHHSIQHEASGYTFYKEKKHLLENIFGSAHTRNRIYLLQNCFSNYLYIKDI